MVKSYRIEGGLSGKSQDSFALNWMLKIIWKGRYKFIDKRIDKWTIKFKKHYPHGMGQLLKDYYIDKSIDHPDFKYLWDDFGD